MFILSQNKSTLINTEVAPLIFIGTTGDKIFAYLTINDKQEFDAPVAEYETPERTREVFYELCNHIGFRTEKLYVMPEN